MDKTRDCLSRLCVLTADKDNVEAVLNAGLLKPVFSTLLDNEADEELIKLALQNMRNMCAHPEAAKKIRTDGRVMDQLANITEDMDKPSASQIATQVVRMLSQQETDENDPTDVSQSVKKPRAITISMRGLLGDREVDSAYTQALLLVGGVVSVTVDPKNERVVIYTHKNDEVRHQLVDAIESVKQRYGYSAAKAPQRQPLGELAAAYLDDNEDDDFFAEGTITERTCETVEQRLARKRKETQKPQRFRKRDVLMGAVSSLFGW